MKSRFVGAGVWTLSFIAVLWWTTTPTLVQQPAPDREARLKAALAKPTPRLPNGKPDLSGFWAEPITSQYAYTRSKDGKTVTVGDADAPELDEQQQPRAKARMADESMRPKYKPQYRAKQRELMYSASLVDPGIHCYPTGVPRLGAPTEIVHTESTVYFMYGSEGFFESEDPTHAFRVVPIGGKHDPEADPTPLGDSIAYWDGDTLVVDVTNLDEDTWIDGDGSFHSDQMHVIERFTRKGDTLDYNVTIEDPKYFMEPFKPVGVGRPAVRLGSRVKIARPAGEHVKSNFPCVEHDRGHKVNNDRF